MKKFKQYSTERERERERQRDLTWVISAEVTHIMTTMKIRSNPALYLQPIGSERRRKMIGLNDVGFASNDQDSGI